MCFALVIPFSPEAFTQPEVLKLGGLAAPAYDLPGKTHLFSVADLQAINQPMGLMWDASPLAHLGEGMFQFWEGGCNSQQDPGL